MPQKSIFKSATDIIVGKSNAFRFVFQCFDLSYTHNFYVMKDATNPIFSKEGFTASSSYDFIEGSLSDDDVLELATENNESPYIPLLVELETYDGDTLIGTDYYTLVLRFTSEYTSPVIGDITYFDTNDDVILVLGSNQFILQGQSNLTLSALCSGQYGAQITDRQIRTPSKNISADANLISFGEVLDSGDVNFELTVTDSRGYVSTATKQITVLPYNSVSIDSASVERTSPISTTAHITLSAKRSVVTVNDVDKNTNTVCSYRKKATSASIWGDWVNITKFLDSNGDISIDASTIRELDAENSYDVEIKIADTWTEATATFIVASGKPALFFATTGKIGVGTLNPQAELDVSGTIAQNGLPILGMMATLTDTDNIDQLFTVGAYLTPTSVTLENGFPSTTGGLLEIFGDEVIVMQRYTLYSGSAILVRMYTDDSWTNWAQISG
ncbi:MAG: DUF859 family phage minor structural protein [Hominilimicola sp.]